jgi:alpha-L-fucosidase
LRLLLEFSKFKIYKTGIVMKKLILIITIALLLAACNKPRNKNTIVKTPYGGSWESLQEMPIPDWFNDGKIGIFIHWGPYSVIGHRKGGKGYA